MIKRHYIGHDFDTLYTVLSQSEFLMNAGATVVNDGSGNPKITIKDSDENTLFTIQKITNSSSVNVEWHSYASSNNSVSAYAGNSSYGATVNYVYTCKNGIIIVVAGHNGGGIGNGMLPIRIVKTNLGKLAFISKRNITSTLFNAYRESMDCIAWGDVAPLSTFYIPNRYDTHYEVVPMLTNSDMDVVSYTDKSGFLLYSTGDLAIKAINISGKKYLSDSYFAIEDE